MLRHGLHRLRLLVQTSKNQGLALQPLRRDQVVECWEGKTRARGIQPGRTQSTEDHDKSEEPRHVLFLVLDYRLYTGAEVYTVGPTVCGSRPVQALGSSQHPSTAVTAVVTMHDCCLLKELQHRDTSWVRTSTRRTWLLLPRAKRNRCGKHRHSTATSPGCVDTRTSAGDWLAGIRHAFPTDIEP